MISSTFMLQCDRYYTNNAIGLQHLSQTNSLPLLTLCRLRTLRVRTRAFGRGKVTSDIRHLRNFTLSHSYRSQPKKV